MDRLRLDLALLIGYLAAGLAFTLTRGRINAPSDEEKCEWIDDKELDAVHQELARWLLNDAWSVFIVFQILGWPVLTVLSVLRVASDVKGRYERWVLARWIGKRMRRIETARAMRERS